MTTNKITVSHHVTFQEDVADIDEPRKHWQAVTILLPPVFIKGGKPCISSLSPQGKIKGYVWFLLTKTSPCIHYWQSSGGARETQHYFVWAPPCPKTSRRERGKKVIFFLPRVPNGTYFLPWRDVDSKRFATPLGYCEEEWGIRIRKPRSGPDLFQLPCRRNKGL